MEKLRRGRVVIARQEKLTVWRARKESADDVGTEKLSLQCPHCGEKAFLLELVIQETPAIEIVSGREDS